MASVEPDGSIMKSARTVFNNSEKNCVTKGTLVRSKHLRELVLSRSFATPFEQKRTLTNSNSSSSDCTQHMRGIRELLRLLILKNKIFL